MKKYTSMEVSEILGVHQKNINYYWTRYEIGNMLGNRLYFYDTDIENIREKMHDRFRRV